MTKLSLETFFNPKSVAVIGASKTPGKLGYNAVQNLLNLGFKGKIYPVNPKGGEVLGLKIYPNVKDIPEPVDVGQILVPAPFVIDIMKDLAEKGVKYVVIITGGFTEAGKDGAKTEGEIIRIAKEAGMRIIGPNTTGIISAPANFSTTFLNFENMRIGDASYIAQTGNFGSITLLWILTKEHFGLCRVIGLGNKCDVDDADALEFLGEDPETKVVGMYVEGLKNGRRFIEVARKAAKKKPVLVLKSGRTKAGARAAASHTASLAADDAIIESALRQAGVIRVKNYIDLVNYAKAFIYQPPPKGNRMGVITPSGGLGVVMADAIESSGLSIKPFFGETLKKLEEITPPLIKVGNPFDIWPAISSIGNVKSFDEGLKAILADPEIDGVILGFMQNKGVDELKDIDFIIETAKKYSDKPIVSFATGEYQLVEKLRKALETNPEVRIPLYYYAEQACEVMSVMYEYTERRKAIA
ncbi:MAG: CoA-binding protein [Candidatus Bathyarchaeota archaeon]|nr:CoA-binding protein [Candidatus Bathyarchaeota archaeon]